MNLVRGPHKNNPFFGKTHTEENRAKIGENNKIHKSLPVYAYIKEEDGKLILIQIFPSTISVGLCVGKTRSFYSHTISRTNGWYKDKLYFSDVELENAEKNIVPLLEFTQIVKELELKRKGFKVRVTNVITGEVTVYDSMQAVTIAIGIDNKGIREKLGTTKLYKRKYKFELLDI